MDLTSAKDIMLVLLPIAVTWSIKKSEERAKLREAEKNSLLDRVTRVEEMIIRQEEMLKKVEDIITVIEDVQNKVGLLAEGLKASLRDRIVQSCTYFVENQGWVPSGVFGNIAKMYHAYTLLGGNDVATRFFEELRKLPMNPPPTTE